MALTRHDLKGSLAQLIDVATLAEILGALSEVCHDMARSTEQDTYLARSWEASSSMLCTVAETSTINRTPPTKVQL